MTGHMAPTNKLQQGPGGTNTNGGKGLRPQEMLRLWVLLISSKSLFFVLTFGLIQFKILIPISIKIFWGVQVSLGGVGKHEK